MISVDAACLRAYSRRKVVEYYSTYAALDKAEEAVLRTLAPHLGSMRMLDIGVGGGRMTEYFAPRVREYHGIDISDEMIAACRRRFLGRVPPERFSLLDMRRLDRYPAHAFDLILNSYNTIDHLDCAERERFIAEARRITRPGGYFCFSTHNIRALSRSPAPRWSWRRPRAALRALRHRARYLKVNREALERSLDADHVIINNGTHDDFDLRIFHVRPVAQLDALAQAGFRRVMVYSLDTGAELNEKAIEKATDRWLYYLCR